MRYKILLFDLDDTLLDFRSDERASLKTLFLERDITPAKELLQRYHKVNSRLWSEYEKCKITLEQVLHSRFYETMLEYGIEIDGVEWERRYRSLLEQNPSVVAGAAKLCSRLSNTHRLFIVTNGIAATQRRRLKKSGLYDYFEHVFDSQSAGYQKPSVKFFEFVADNIEGFEKNQALITGDSLKTDIAGGAAFGIDTCWYNKGGLLPPPGDIQITYMIDELEQLYDLCL
jgi:2-haloacid dehalogenase